MIRAWKAVVALSALALLTVPVVCAAQGQDELWEVTNKMEMVGVPMAMPPQTQQVCRPTGRSQEEEMVPKDRDCRMTDVNRSGNRTTFTMVCEGKDRFTGTGDITSDRDSYRGTMRMKGTMDGRPVDMTQAFSGRRVGSCTYEDPRQRQNTMMAQQCGQALDQMQTPMFTMEQSPCKSMKSEFCSRVSRTAQDMRDPAGYRATAERRADWQQMLSACNQDPVAVTQAACARSVEKRDYGFTAQYCEADARALAKQNCEGRAYTAAMSSEFAPICQGFASRPAGRSYTAQPRQSGVPPAQAGTPAQAPNVTDTVKEGADLLKKFLKW
jgi:hypothetical protein